MPQTCTICRHPEHTEIDTALIRSEPLRNIAEQFGTTVASLHRHRPHIPQALALAKQAEEAVEATTLLDGLKSLTTRLNRIAEKAEKDRAWSSATSAIREIRGCLTLLAQIRGELQLGSNMNINVAITLRRVQTTVLSTTPDDFGQFWRELIDKASEEQIEAAYAALPDRAVQKGRLDLSVLTTEELNSLERIVSKASKG
jgi:hypothetical protein